MHSPARHLANIIGGGNLIAMARRGSFDLFFASPRKAQRRVAGRILPLAALTLAVLLLMGCGEWARAVSGRPPVLQQTLVAKGISGGWRPSLRQEILPRAPRSGLQEGAEDSKKTVRAPFTWQVSSAQPFGAIDNGPLRPADNRGRKVLAALLSGGLFQEPKQPVTAGPEAAENRLLFEQNCTLCHAAELVRERTAGWSRGRIRQALDELNRLHPAMPDYRGTAQEKDRLADYIRHLNRLREEPSSMDKD